ncbi:hypothetical protein FNF27_03212 [Cafeteria roenbergensis]|uniref:Uncharacterized protein n=1 Tax=Cafeteria roenbergensis TaxID=33653 RepID=A0A5A8EDC4_CAFRO|nr:hypothetical protein FNF27_03212 [Cafeteria roenbergensis]
MASAWPTSPPGEEADVQDPMARAVDTWTSDEPPMEWSETLGMSWLVFVGENGAVCLCILVLALWQAWFRRCSCAKKDPPARRSAKCFDFRSFCLSVVAAAMAVRLAWLVDPFGFFQLWSLPVQALLLHLPQSLLYLAVLLLIAMWRRVVTAAERLHRIRSAVIVGRYKWVLGSLGVVLLGASGLGVLAAAAVADSALVRGVVRGVFSCFAVGYFVWGSLYATQFLDVLAGSDSDTARCGPCAVARAWCGVGGLCCCCADSPERMACLCALCQCVASDTGVDVALKGTPQAGEGADTEEDVLDDALASGCCSNLCARCCGRCLWGGRWGASAGAGRRRRVDDIRVGPGTRVLTARRPISVATPVAEVEAQVQREQAAAHGAARQGGGGPRHRRRAGATRAQQEARARLRATVTLLLLAGLAYFALVTWGFVLRFLHPLQFLLVAWGTQAMEQTAAAALIYAMYAEEAGAGADASAGLEPLADECIQWLASEWAAPSGAGKAAVAGGDGDGDGDDEDAFDDDDDGYELGEDGAGDFETNALRIGGKRLPAPVSAAEAAAASEARDRIAFAPSATGARFTLLSKSATTLNPAAHQR